MKRLVVPALLLVALVGSSVAQRTRSGQKPVLIRADEPKEEEEIVYYHNPEAAKQNVEIGDFYLKRDNLRAAEQRYREAIKYNTGWPDSYLKLIKLLEKKGEFQSAIEVCQLFVESNPDSKKMKDFLETEDQLKKEIKD
jgi:tetratricopeptide (TPR) repeat protein